MGIFYSWQSLSWLAIAIYKPNRHNELINKIANPIVALTVVFGLTQFIDVDIYQNPGIRRQSNNRHGLYNIAMLFCRRLIQVVLL
jgi:hypothetical protein